MKKLEETCIKTSGSPVYVYIKKNDEYYEPIYLKFFVKIDGLYYNRTGNSVFYDHSRCYKIKSGVKYSCQVSFNKEKPDPEEFILLAYDNKGEKIKYGDWECDITDETASACEPRKEKDVIIKMYDFVIDRLYESKSKQACMQYAMAPYSEMARESTKFVIIDLPGHFRAYQWFTGNQMTDQIYNYARYMSKYLENSRNFLLFDNDIRAKVPKGIPISEALRPKNEKSTRSRYSLKIIYSDLENEDDIVFSECDLTTKDSKASTEIRSKSSSKPIALIVEEASCDFCVTVYGMTNQYKKDNCENVSYRHGYHSGYIVKKGKFLLSNHVNEDGFSFCFLEFVALDTEREQKIKFKWATSHDYTSDFQRPVICGEYLERKDGLNKLNSIDNIDSEQFTLVLNKERVRIKSRQKHSGGGCYIRVDELSEGAKIQLEVHGCCNREGPNLTTDGDEIVDGVIIEKTGNYVVSNCVIEYGFNYCYLSFLPLTSGKNVIKFVWSPSVINKYDALEPIRRNI